MAEEGRQTVYPPSDIYDYPRGTKLRLQECAFRVLLGTSLLRPFAKMTEQEWSESAERLAERTRNVNVVGTLAVATSAVFLTTNAPGGVLLINWNRELPYFCLAACAGCGILATMSGLSLLVFLNATSHKSMEAAMQSKYRSIVIYTLLTMPFAFLFAATLFAGIAWLGAVWLGNTLWIKLVVSIGCTVFVFTLLVIGVALYE